MKKRLITGILALGCVLATVGATNIIQDARSQSKLSALLRAEIQADEVYEPAKQPARKKRAWQLYNLWSKRDQNKRVAASQIIPFLQDEHGKLRENAALMLGRLEDPVAKAPLQKLLSEVRKGTARKNYVRPEILKLALGRIEARNLRGQAKLDAIAKRVGLSWGEVLLLSQKIKANYADSTAGHRIVREVVDILYEIGARGENIQPWAKKLDLYPAQKLLLQSANLPPDKRAKRMVEHLAQLNLVTAYDIDLGEFYLMNLRPQTLPALLQKLRSMKEGTAKYGKRGYLELFRVSALIGDSRAIPLLQHFAKTSSQPMSGYAKQSLDGFGILQNSQKWTSPRSPWAPSLD